MTTSSLPVVAQLQATADDTRTGGLVRSLDRPVHRLPQWGIVRTMVYGAVSFGVLPLLVWPGELREMIDAEARQLEELADWARARGRVPAAVGPLRAAAQATAARPIICLLPMLIGLLIAGTLVTHSHHLLDQTYGSPMAGDWPPPADFLHALFGVWTVGLGIAYLIHWLNVRAHVADVRRFVSRFNQMADSERFALIPLPRNAMGIQPLWIAGGLFLAFHGGWWAVPMAIAGAAHCRYAKLTSAATRGGLAARVRQMMIVPRPQMPRCATLQCQAPLPAGAAFCPRCGATASAFLVQTWAHR